jgi:hypothetical protein
MINPEWTEVRNMKLRKIMRVENKPNIIDTIENK